MCIAKSIWNCSLPEIHYSKLSLKSQAWKFAPILKPLARSLYQSYRGHSAEDTDNAASNISKTVVEHESASRRLWKCTKLIHRWTRVDKNGQELAYHFKEVIQSRPPLGQLVTKNSSVCSKAMQSQQPQLPLWLLLSPHVESHWAQCTLAVGRKERPVAACLRRKTGKMAMASHKRKRCIEGVPYWVVEKHQGRVMTSVWCKQESKVCKSGH